MILHLPCHAEPIMEDHSRPFNRPLQVGLVLHHPMHYDGMQSPEAYLDPGRRSDSQYHKPVISEWYEHVGRWVSSRRAIVLPSLGTDLENNNRSRWTLTVSLELAAVVVQDGRNLCPE